MSVADRLSGTENQPNLRHRAAHLCPSRIFNFP